ncbi:MAG TPA: hypothetical protein VFZ09_42220 [Archangium sp.]|uniref:hypothetical protein n=1 Tax=Archangium sp. TaxID=1872627 RepID=UPI002E355A3D|nr:hypothetical protein [Archangium sp.]HEX5752895.1 hypothetical protein [Archangium sp.]
MRDTAGARSGVEAERSELASLRRQLEGGLEVLEACSARYRELSEALQARRWKERLRQAPSLLHSALQAESSLPEVLTRLQRRAGQEPEGKGPASRWLREFEEERTELSRRIARRLSLRKDGSLTERLGRLEAVALAPLPLPPSEGETVLLEGNARWPPVWHWMIFLVVWAFVSPLEEPWVVVLVALLFYGWFYVRSGRYWLTSERLLWKPRLGAPVQLQLSSLEEGQVSVGATSIVRVRGRNRMTLRYVPDAWRLAALLCIYRRREFRGAVRRDPRPLIAFVRMYITTPGETPNMDSARSGWGVLRPGFAAFFSGHLYSRIIEAITEPSASSRGPERRSREKVDVSDFLVLEQLQFLPEERIDALLRKALEANPESFLWEPREMTWRFGNSASMEVSRGGTALWVPSLSWTENQHVGRILEHWRPE